MCRSFPLAEITIELFGTARLASERRRIELQVPAQASVGHLVTILAGASPALVGIALREDLSGLLESYVLNVNGTEFVEGDELTLRDGDTLMLFSSLAGG